MTLATWSKYSEWPMLGVAVLFLAAYSAQVIASLRPAQHSALEAVIWVTWAVFAFDYAIHLWLAPRRKRWFLKNLHELALLILPVLRPLQLLRLITLMQFFHRAGGNALRGRIVAYVMASAALLIYAGALAVLDVEQNAEGSNLTTFGDALWWAMTTITTVGYGDHYPVTGLGRLVAAGLMVGGVAVIGVVTASVASWLVENVADRDTDAAGNDPALTREVARLSRQIDQLSAQLADRGQPAAHDGQENRA
ncbi:potassium channel family protein [Arthrobacter oryzae]|uniref:Two pore domain potassium channel family protein n=1 Tax=Arthrobacter oryzae TaxID=409290 RepID=A0A3N0BY54_9MICC|nr:potassium channel family protein [Arthrobacter oryzae]RNL54679.1 two pore domain potassium channel family protein [Arthrobacter oryzae]